MAEVTARNYVLRLMEGSRADAMEDEFDGYPTLEPGHIDQAYDALTAEASHVTVGFPPDRRFPVVREDGRVHYCRTTESMDLETVNAALVALAAEAAWLDHYRAQRAEEFAALLSLRSLRGLLEPGES
jgi:hypothetical protein